MPNLSDVTNCEVCAEELTDAEREIKKWPVLNGLPEDMRACAKCRQAVKDRRLGVSVNIHGKLHIIGVDGQGQQRWGH